MHSADPLSASSQRMRELSRLADLSPEQAISLGNALHFAQLPLGAFAALRHAVQCDPSRPEAWLALLRYFTAENLLFSARAVAVKIHELGGSERIPESSRIALSTIPDPPQVSLYIPCYNAEGSIAQVVDAVRGQTCVPGQIIIVDDCSNDRTVEIVRGFSQVDLLSHSHNRGVGAARNTAIEAARAPLIASVDSDVIASPFWLERLLIAMYQNPIIGAFGALVERHCELPADRWRSRIMPLRFPGSADIDDAVLYGSNTLFTAEALRALGGYDPQFTRAFDDTDLGNKIRAAGLHIRYVHNALCQHTRKDTLQSVLRNCHAYRKHTAVKHRMYASPEALEGRWRSVAREGLREIEELASAGSASLAFTSLLNIFWTVVQDLREFLAVESSPARCAWVVDALAALRLSLQQVGEYLPSTVVLALERHLSEPLKALPSELVSTSLLPRDPSKSQNPMFERCFSHFAAVLRFPPELAEALGAGALRSVTPRDPTEAHRVCVIDLEFLLHWRTGAERPRDALLGAQSTRALSVPSTLCADSAQQIDCAVFDWEMPVWDECQLPAALKGYDPHQILLVARESHREQVYQGLLLLAEMLGRPVPITVTDFHAGLDPWLPRQMSVAGVSYSQALTRIAHDRATQRVSA